MLGFSLLLCVAVLPAEDVRSAIERLSAPSAVERRAAERWLAAHLDPEDLELVAEVAAAADLEVRSRLASAVGSDDRHFTLAALLASDYEPTLRALGRSALERMIVRWYGEQPLFPVPAEEVERLIADRFSGVLYRMSLGLRPLDEEIGAIVRHMGAPEGLPTALVNLGVALDPGLYVRSLEGRTVGPSTRRSGSLQIDGTPDKLLFYAAILPGRNATLEGFAFHGPRAWLHVVDRDRAATRSGSDLLLEWVAAAIEHRDEPEGEGAARALAGSEWPAALGWMAQRWADFSDRNSLAGLLLAADRGYVAPELATTGSVERLLRAAEEELAKVPPGTLFAEEALRAVGAMGPVGADGTDLAAVVASGWNEGPEVNRRLRLGALTRMRSAPPEVRAALRSWLELPGAQPSARLRLEALRTLAATSFAAERPGSFPVAAPARLFDTADELGLGAVDDWLVAIAARPPESWRDPTALPAGWGADRRGRVLVWWIQADPEGDAAVRHLAALFALDPEAELEVGDRLERLVLGGRRPEVERVFTRAGELRGRPLDRLALVAGVLPDERELDLLETLLIGGRAQTQDLALIGLLAASPGDAGEPARLALTAAVEAGVRSGGRGAPWVEALRRAIDRLRRGPPADSGARKLEDRILRELRSDLRGTKHPLGPDVRRGSWPPPPGLEPIVVEALEIRLDP